jgi:O-antigen ligase
MYQRLLSIALLVLCGLGLLVGWVPDQFLWNISEGLVFLLVILWTAAWLAGRAEARWSWMFVPVAAVAAWGCVQLRMNWSVYAFATKQDVIRWSTYLAVLFLGVQLFGTRRTGTTFRRVFTVYSIVLAIVSIFQWFVGNGKIFWVFPTHETAGMGPFLNYDHYASFIALALPMAVVEMFRNPRQRWFFALAAAVLYASVLAAASRAGFVLLTLELILLSLLLGFSWRAAAAVVWLVLIFGTVIGWGHLYDRLQLPDPYGGRREVASSSIEMFRSNPWHGFGLGTWTQVYPAYAQKDFGVFINAAHNDWLQWACDGGLPVAGSLFLLFCGACALVKRVPWALGVPIVFVHGVIDFPMQGRFLPAIVFLVLGTAIRNAAEHQKRQSVKPSLAG